MTADPRSNASRLADAEHILSEIRLNQTSWVERHGRDMPWEQILSKEYPTSAIAGLLLHSDSNIEDGLLALIECALRDGHPEILDTCEVEQLLIATPVLLVINEGYARVLQKYIEAGFDPEARNPGSGMNALDVATHVGGQPEIEAMLRSRTARRKIGSILEQVDVADGYSPSAYFQMG